VTNKRPSKMSYAEAVAALARERRLQAGGWSYSGRRIGELLRRIAALNPAVPSPSGSPGR